jgi:hypothetical protein
MPKNQGLQKIDGKMGAFVNFTRYLFGQDVFYKSLKKGGNFLPGFHLPLSRTVAFGAILLFSFSLIPGLGCQSRIERHTYNLQDKSTSKRVLAVEALSKIDDKRTVGPLIEALKDKDPDVVWRAAAALGDKGDNRAIKPLIATLKYKDFAVQHFVEAALVKIGSPAVKPLIAALKNANSDVLRVKAITVLGKIGDKGAVGPLILALKDTEVDTVRVAAAIALGKIGDNRALKPLILALKDPYSVLQDEAVAALVKIGEPAVEPLIAALEDTDTDAVRVAAAIALGKIGDNRAVEPLILALKDRYSVLQDEAVAALVKIGEPAVGPLITRLKNKSVTIRVASATVLGIIGDKRAVHSLVEALTDWEVRHSAAMALDSLGWKPVISSNRIHYLYAKGQKNELLNEWELTNKTLSDDLRSGKKQLIQYAVYAFIDLKGDYIIPDLIKILDSTGDVFIAQVYLDSGHQELMESARRWADRHGFSAASETNNVGLKDREGDRTSQ